MFCKIKNIAFFGFILTLLSCGNGIVDKPKNLIDKDIMVDILYDLSIVEALHNSSYNNGKINFVSTNYIFKKYKIDSLQFAKSNQYYATDVKVYKKIFEAVNDRLNEKDIELSKNVLVKVVK